VGVLALDALHLVAVGVRVGVRVRALVRVRARARARDGGRLFWSFWSF